MAHAAKFFAGRSLVMGYRPVLLEKIADDSRGVTARLRSPERHDQVPGVDRMAETTQDRLHPLTVAERPGKVEFALRER